jgi:hypothetical protein
VFRRDDQAEETGLPQPVEVGLVEVAPRLPLGPLVPPLAGDRPHLVQYARSGGAHGCIIAQA